MKTLQIIRRCVCVGLLFALLVTASNFTLAQGKIAAELSVDASSADGFVTINGERALSGRSVLSPAEIVTSPEATAKVSLAKTGVVIIAPNSKARLSFDQAKISGDFQSGKLKLDVPAGTALSLRTPDGTIAVSGRDEETVFNVALENGRTRIGTLSGVATFNGVPVPAGQVYPLGSDPSAAVLPDPQTTPGAGAGGISNTTLFVIIAVAGAVGLGAALALSGGGDDDRVVSPVR
jgi:hypothetical protein